MGGLSSMHQNPHHLTSEHALSLPCHKGGHRWSPASHAMGVTSTKCCCSSCVRNVPCGVNALSLDCSHRSQCQWAQPCICLCWFYFLLKFSEKLNSVRNMLCVAFFLSAVGMLLVQNLLLLLRCVYCDWVLCINFAASCGDRTSSLSGDTPNIPFFAFVGHELFLSVKTQTEQ